MLQDLTFPSPIKDQAWPIPRLSSSLRRVDLRLLLESLDRLRVIASDLRDAALREIHVLAELFDLIPVDERLEPPEVHFRAVRLVHLEIDVHVPQREHPVVRRTELAAKFAEDLERLVRAVCFDEVAGVD